MADREIGGKYAVTAPGSIYELDTGLLIPEGEPVYLLRASDPLAAQVLRRYEILLNLEKLEASDQVMAAVHRQLSEFYEWRAANRQATGARAGAR